MAASLVVVPAVEVVAPVVGGPGAGTPPGAGARGIASGAVVGITGTETLPTMPEEEEEEEEGGLSFSSKDRRLVGAAAFFALGFPFPSPTGAAAALGASFFTALAMTGAGAADTAAGAAGAVSVAATGAAAAALSAS